jgi:hypothetical protein
LDDVADTLARMLPIAGLGIGVVAFVGAWLHRGEVVTAGRRLGWALHVIARPDPPQREPIEQVAADVRRLARAVSRLPPGCPMVRRRATIAAYDDALVDACRALEIATSLPDLPDGLGREVERLRVECDLRRAGLVMDEAA